MKPTYQFFILSITIFYILTLFIGCSAQKPSEAEVKKLVEKKLSKSIPISWVKNSDDVAVYGIKDIEIKSIKIDEWGKFNEARQYWPAKIKVSGSVMGIGKVMGLTSYADCDFEGIAEFTFYQDDFGKWKASKK